MNRTEYEEMKNYGKLVCSKCGSEVNTIVGDECLGCFSRREVFLERGEHERKIKELEARIAELESRDEAIAYAYVDGLRARIAELEAENERMQWHYRKDGLLPVEGGVLFVTEGDEYIWMGYYKNGLFYDSDGDTTMPKYVARWKYID